VEIDGFVIDGFVLNAPTDVISLAFTAVLSWTSYSSIVVWASIGTLHTPDCVSDWATRACRASSDTDQHLHAVACDITAGQGCAHDRCALGGALLHVRDGFVINWRAPPGCTGRSATSTAAPGPVRPARSQALLDLAPPRWPQQMALFRRRPVWLRERCADARCSSTSADLSPRSCPLSIKIVLMINVVRSMFEFGLQARLYLVLLVADGAVGALLQQQPHDLHVPPHAGPVQRRVVSLQTMSLSLGKLELSELKCATKLHQRQHQTNTGRRALHTSARLHEIFRRRTRSRQLTSAPWASR